MDLSRRLPLSFLFPRLGVASRPTFKPSRSNFTDKSPDDTPFDMIAGLSKAITLYLAPILALTAILLSLFALLAPTLLLHDQVALLTVASSQKELDGPSVFMGVLGSCARGKNIDAIGCTPPSLSPQYDLAVLPKAAPTLLLSAPAASAPAFIAVAIVFSILFFVVFSLVSFRDKMGAKLESSLGKPIVQNGAAWMGVFSFIIGITSFLIIRMWFGKAVQDFNASIALQGQEAPRLVASLGNAFTMVWVSHAFFAVPVIISLAKLNVKATKA